MLGGMCAYRILAAMAVLALGTPTGTVEEALDEESFNGACFDEDFVVLNDIATQRITMTN